MSNIIFITFKPAAEATEEAEVFKAVFKIKINFKSAQEVEEL